MKLALVVPALNEEDAIAGTLRRCLAAREKVVSQTPLEAMEVVFVNDGSTDRTQEVVDQPEFDDVIKVRFEKNRGYGAAIKAGWQATDADFVGFIDGDGTCDPDFCVPLFNRLDETQADVVLACRLNPQSKMPLIRQVGNRIFASLLGLVSGKQVIDSASGFRIVRRSSLKLLTPLPDGLHFTPAMSAICMLDPRLSIQEVPMPYEDRIGESKLSVVKDGFRFLWTIMFAAACYAPIKTMLGLALGGVAVVGVIATLVAMLSSTPSQVHSIMWAMIAILAMLVVGGGVITHQLNFLMIGPRKQVGALERALQAMLEFSRLMIGGAIVTAVALVGLVIVGLLGIDSNAKLTIALMLSVLAAMGTAGVVGGVILRVIWAVRLKHEALIHDQYAIPTHPADTTAPDAQAGTVSPASATTSRITAATGD